MLTVETDTAAVEERLRSGRLACPGCAGVLAGWGRARARTVRGPDGGVRVVPRRSRCTGCRATHVLLPVLLLVRRADTADGDRGGARSEGVWWRASRDRRAAGAAARDGARLAAALRHSRRGGAGGVHPAVPGVGAGSGAARPGRVRVGRRGRRGDRRGAGRSWPGSPSRCRSGRSSRRSRRAGCCRRAGPLRPTSADQHELPLTSGGSSSVIIAACPDKAGMAGDEEVAHPWR